MIEDRLPSSKKARPSEATPCLSQSAISPSSQSTNHAALVAVSKPPFPYSIAVQELDVANDASRPVPIRLAHSLREDAPDTLTDEHVPVSQRFFHLVAGKSAGGFSGFPADLARQM